MITEELNTLKALADETRFKLVTLLLTHDFCVGGLARHLGISEAAVSQHLKYLRETGLVRGEKRGYWTFYSMEKEKLHELAELLGRLVKLRPCSEGVCIKKINNRIDCHKGDGKICDCNCQCPEKLKNCTPDRIRESRQHILRG